jgi:putative tricarboxylic transport membrane protein
MDGYESAKQGRGGPALGIAAISSFVAGTMSLVSLIFFAPVLAHFTLAFGPPEYFALMFMGLSSVISLSGCALLKGLIDVWVALIFGVIGYLLRKLGFPIAPMVLASVLAQMLETSL